MCLHFVYIFVRCVVFFLRVWIFCCVFFKQLNVTVHLTIDMKETKKEDVELNVCVPRASLRNESGDKIFNNWWLERWGEIHHNLTVSINSGASKWTDRYALYSYQNNLVKSKDDFVDAVIEVLDNDSNDVKQVTFTIKV